MPNDSRVPGSATTIGPTSRNVLVSGPAPLSHDLRAPVGSQQRPAGGVLVYGSHTANITEADQQRLVEEGKAIWPLKP
jgi:hypothetical protein